MTELLFSDEAKHYLFSGRTPQETFLFTVTSSEVNVIVRIQIPNVIFDSILIIQATKLGDEGGTLILRPLTAQQEEADDIKQKNSILMFFDDMIDKTEQIQAYIKAKQQNEPEVLEYLKTHLHQAKLAIEK